MKPLLPILLLSATAAHAGGLSNPISEPRPTARVSANPVSVTDFTGFYAGISAGQRTVTTTTVTDYSRITPTYTEEPVYDWCTDNGGHSGGDKCKGDRNNIDLTFGPDLPFHENWTQTGLYGNNQDRAFLKGEPVTIVGAEGNVLGQGLADGTNPSGTLYRLETGLTETVQGPNLVENWTETLTEVAEDATYGVFAGYRHQLGPVVAGVEAGFSADLQTLDLQAGLPVGNVLPYAFAGVAQSDYGSGTSFGFGADLMLSGGWMIGTQYREATFETAEMEGLALRVGYSF